MDQTVIDRAVRTATKAALNGNPVARIVWIPTNTATEDHRGTFVVEYAGPMAATDNPPWEV
jgi:hypothetical protein